MSDKIKIEVDGQIAEVKEAAGGERCGRVTCVTLTTHSLVRCYVAVVLTSVRCRYSRR